VLLLLSVTALVLVLSSFSSFSLSVWLTRQLCLKTICDYYPTCNVCFWHYSGPMFSLSFRRSAKMSECPSPYPEMPELPLPDLIGSSEVLTERHRRLVSLVYDFVVVFHVIIMMSFSCANTYLPGLKGIPGPFFTRQPNTALVSRLCIERWLRLSRQS